MSAYDSNPHTEDRWTRGQIVRTTIIFAQIVVLFVAILLTSMQQTTGDVVEVETIEQVNASYDYFDYTAMNYVDLTEMDSLNTDNQSGESSTIEDLVSEASEREAYDYGLGYGCSGGH